LELDETLYALDATTNELCLKLFPWATFRKRKDAIKLHVLLALKVNILDELIFEVGSFYIMDRGYLDFERLYRFHQFHASFVVRAKTNLQYRRLYSRRVNRSTGLRCDQIIRFTGPLLSKYYPEKLRLVKFYDQEHDLRFVILTDIFFPCLH